MAAVEGKGLSVLVRRARKLASIGKREA